jgi:hypothetical protein
MVQDRSGGSASPDPKPVAPEKPLPMDCCDSGCDRCVFDIYAEEQAAYEAALAAWRARHCGDRAPPRS